MVQRRGSVRGSQTQQQRSRGSWERGCHCGSGVAMYTPSRWGARGRCGEAGGLAAERRSSLLHAGGNDASRAQLSAAQGSRRQAALGALPLGARGAARQLMWRRGKVHFGAARRAAGQRQPREPWPRPPPPPPPPSPNQLTTLAYLDLARYARLWPVPLNWPLPSPPTCTPPAVDGIYHVCRAFEDADVIHVEDRVDPVADLEIIHSELRAKVRVPPVMGGVGHTGREVVSKAHMVGWQ